MKAAVRQCPPPLPPPPPKLCPAGKYPGSKGASGTVACVPCVNNQYKPTAGSSSCLVCPAGSGLVGGVAGPHVDCQPCQGIQASITGVACQDCAPGTKPSFDRKTCDPFPATGCAICTNSATFVRCMEAVNAKCCDEKSEDCSSGEPATCNADCAAVLVPTLQKCQADFFALPEMAMAMAPAKQALKHAAAKCPTVKLSSCRSLHEYSTLLNDMVKDCCASATNCESGAPKHCSARCVKGLRRLIASCKSFMESAPSYYRRWHI